MFSIKTVEFQVPGPLWSLFIGSLLPFLLVLNFYLSRSGSGIVFPVRSFLNLHVLHQSYCLSPLLCRTFFCTLSKIAGDVPMSPDGLGALWGKPCSSPSPPHHSTQCRHQVHPLFLVTAIHHLKIPG